MAAMESRTQDAYSASADATYVAADPPGVAMVDVAAAAHPLITGLDEPHWTAKRRKLLAWLERKAPELAAVYAGAVRMAADTSFPGRVRFVWHAIREIRNRLPDTLAGEVSSAMVQWGDVAGEVWRCWTEDGWPEDGQLSLTETAEPSAAGPERYEISRALLLAVANVASAHAGILNRNEENARRFFEAVAGSGVPRYVVRAWVQGVGRAHGLAHVSNKPLDPAYEESLESDLAAFEVALFAIVNRSYENMDQLDELLVSANRRRT